MMRSLLMLAIATLVLTAMPAAVSAAPPARPLTLTAGQFEALQQTQAQPEHAAVLDTHASFQDESDRLASLEATRLSDDIFTAAYTGGFPVGLLLVLIAAAPL